METKAVWAPLTFSPPFSSLNFTPLHLPHLLSSSVVLSSVLAVILEPFSHPNRPNFGPSRLWTPYFFENVNFQKNERHPSESTILEIGVAQDRPKMALRSPQDDLQEHLFSSSFSCSILVRFGIHFGCHLGSFLAQDAAQAPGLVAAQGT